jgi:deoxyribonuclease-4
MHLSFKDGPKLAKDIGCQALQIFCGNPRGWQKSPLDPAFVETFRAGLKEHGIDPLVVHATYLINPASNVEKFYQLSSESIVTELQRAAQVGAKYYVLHIGNHGGAGPEIGRKRVAACMQHAASMVPDGPEILFENTSGSGTTLGTTFEEIAQLMDEAKLGNRLGLCLDTCHALAAGYDIRDAEGVKAMLDKIESTLGLERLKCIHLNDSKGELGSKLDRHEHIGKGCIGNAGFHALFSDKRVWNLPAILETPRESIRDEWDNLWAAIDIAKSAGAMNTAAFPERPTRPELSAKEVKLAAALAAEAAAKKKAKAEKLAAADVRAPKPAKAVAPKTPVKAKAKFKPMAKAKAKVRSKK